MAEAGRGGTTAPCFDGAEGPACMGATGAVTKIDRRGRQYADRRRASPPTRTRQTSDSAIGPHGIIVLGKDTVIITNGGPTAPTVRRPAGATITREDARSTRTAIANLFGRILLIGPHGMPDPARRHLRASSATSTRTRPSATRAVDSNPVDVEVDGLSLVVADAGGNALDAVNVLGRDLEPRRVPEPPA